MMISTRGRYALRVMADLAEHRGGGWVPLSQIAERQEISQKYLESIMAALTKGGLVEGASGKGGGYRLRREPSEYPLGEILRLTEGSLAPVACLEPGAAACPRAERCRTLPMWRELDRVIAEFFDSRTVAELMTPEDGGDYVI
jgi:Rrf2 family iron-sulfur cluster assembly transcriptional regulator